MNFKEAYKVYLNMPLLPISERGFNLRNPTQSEVWCKMNSPQYFSFEEFKKAVDESDHLHLFIKEMERKKKKIRINSILLIQDVIYLVRYVEDNYCVAVSSDGPVITIIINMDSVVKDCLMVHLLDCEFYNLPKKTKGNQLFVIKYGTAARKKAGLKAFYKKGVKLTAEEIETIIQLKIALAEESNLK
jgi:hypothetical protein